MEIIRKRNIPSFIVEGWKKRRNCTKYYMGKVARKGAVGL
jgi:hypothetical protein